MAIIYTYQCHECGKTARMGKVLRCGGCGKYLCPKCSTFEFCPSCFQQLLPSDQDRARRGRRNFYVVNYGIYIYCGIIVGALILYSISDLVIFMGIVTVMGLGFFVVVCLLICFMNQYSPNEKMKQAMWNRAIQAKSALFKPQSFNINTQKLSNLPENNIETTKDSKNRPIKYLFDPNSRDTNRDKDKTKKLFSRSDNPF
jgi:hypothetical protein